MKVIILFYFQSIKKTIMLLIFRVFRLGKEGVCLGHRYMHLTDFRGLKYQHTKNSLFFLAYSTFKQRSVGELVNAPQRDFLVLSNFQYRNVKLAIDGTHSIVHQKALLIFYGFITTFFNIK